MSTKKKCDGCERDYDFNIYAFGWCSTHDKDFCWTCAHTKSCVEGERCDRMFMTNPSAIINLRCSKNE